jgi:hypothetical protein
MAAGQSSVFGEFARAERRVGIPPQSRGHWIRELEFDDPAGESFNAGRNRYFTICQEATT